MKSDRSLKPRATEKNYTTHNLAHPNLEAPEEIEVEMYRYIISQTDYLSNQDETRERLLKHYIELYAHNPEAYPMVLEDETHRTVLEAGNFVLNKS